MDFLKLPAQNLHKIVPVKHVFDVYLTKKHNVTGAVLRKSYLYNLIFG
jgi:hypothetical protein